MYTVIEVELNIRVYNSLNTLKNKCTICFWDFYWSTIYIGDVHSICVHTVFGFIFDPCTAIYPCLLLTVTYELPRCVSARCRKNLRPYWTVLHLHILCLGSSVSLLTLKWCSFYTVRWNGKPPSKDMTKHNKTQLLHSKDFVKEVFMRPFLDRLQMSAFALHLPDFTTLFLAFSRTIACVRRPPKDICLSRDDQQVPETDVVSCHKPQINFGLFITTILNLSLVQLSLHHTVVALHCYCLAERGVGCD